MQGLRRDIPFCNVPALGLGVYMRKDSAGMSRSLLYHGHACHRSCICTMGMHVIGDGLQLCIKLSADCAAFSYSNENCLVPFEDWLVDRKYDPRKFSVEPPLPDSAVLKALPDSEGESELESDTSTSTATTVKLE